MAEGRIVGAQAMQVNLLEYKSKFPLAMRAPTHSQLVLGMVRTKMILITILVKLECMNKSEETLAMFPSKTMLRLVASNNQMFTKLLLFIMVRRKPKTQDMVVVPLIGYKFLVKLVIQHQ